MLLLDENLSPKLIARIRKCFPGCLHVMQAKLGNSPDIDIWHYARDQELTIVSKDRDFLHFAKQHGHPPKLLYINTGNAKLAVIESILIENDSSIKSFIKQGKTGILQIG